MRKLWNSERLLVGEFRKPDMQLYREMLPPEIQRGADARER